MSSSVVVGSGKVAETMAALLATTGRRVALVAPKFNSKSQTNIRQILQDDSEAKIPFMFVDDVRHQQALAKRNFDRLAINSDLNAIDAVETIVDATTAEDGHLLQKTLMELRASTVISLNEKSPVSAGHVSLRLYQPILETRTAKVFTTSETSQETVGQVQSLLESMGIAVLSQKDSLVADRFVFSPVGICNLIRGSGATRGLLKELSEVQKSQPLTKLMTTLTTPLHGIPPPAVQHEYQLF